MEKTLAYDIVGENPTAPEGKFFQINFSTWPVLVQLCQRLAPDECGPSVADWYGDDSFNRGLTPPQVQRLARKLLDVSSISSCIPRPSQPPARILEVIAQTQQESAHHQDALSIGLFWDFLAFLENCGGFRIGLFSLK